MAYAAKKAIHQSRMSHRRNEVVMDRTRDTQRWALTPRVTNAMLDSPYVFEARSCSALSSHHLQPHNKGPTNIISRYGASQHCPRKKEHRRSSLPSSSTWGHDDITLTHADFDSLHLGTLMPCKMTDVHSKKLVDGLVRYKTLRRTVSVCFLTVAGSRKTRPTLILPSAAVSANGKLIESSCPRDHDTSRKYVKTHSRWFGNIRDLL